MLLILIFVFKGTGRTVSHTVLRKNKQITFPDIRTYPKATLIKSVFDWLGLDSLSNGIG